MDTASPHSDDAQPLGASLRRRSDDQILLGLCAGVARSIGSTTLAFRAVTLIAALIVLPFALVAYVAAAVIVPRDDGAALIGPGQRDRRDVVVALALTLLAAPVALSVGDGDGGPFLPGGVSFGVLVLAVLGTLAGLAVRRDRDRNPGDAASAAPAPSVARQAARNASVAGAAVVAAASHADAQPVPNDAPGDAATPADDATQVQPAPPNPAAPNPAAGDPAPAADPEPTQATPAGSTPPRPPRRPGLTLPILAVTAMVPAAFAILLASGAVATTATSWSIMLAVMAVVAASGAVAIAVLRPSYLGAGVLVLLAVTLGIGSIGVGQFGAVIDDGFGEREYRVTTVDDLATPFVLGAGELNIDLRPLRLRAHERVTVRARLGFGQLNIAVPRGVRVLTTAASGASALTTTARENGASNADSASAPTIVLDLRGRGLNARLVTGRERDVSNLAVLATTDLGFWSGGRHDAPFDRSARPATDTRMVR